MTKVVNWQDFDKLIMIRKLRDLVGEWWNVQMHFTDEKGLLRGVPSGKFFSPLNPISEAIVKDPKGFNWTMEEVKKTTINASISKRPQVVRNDSGFSALFVPLRVKGKNLGCVFADGFLSEVSLSEQKSQVRNYLYKVFGAQAEDMICYIDELPVLAEKDLHYLCELIKLVASEMIQAQVHLSRMRKNLHDERKKVAQLTGELGGRFHFSKMVGKSQQMQQLYRMIEKICDSTATVLVRGENGTGKELIARALHYNSIRRRSQFLVVNCGAFNDNLLESELFGHVKGAFTGAGRDKKGVFEAADGGTLFLDEIGDTSSQMQVKLLRVLQEGTFSPVGSTVIKTAKVRIVAATNRNLEEMMVEGVFREDLYYRLNVILLEIPPLRERKEDIPLLMNYFFKKHQATLEGDLGPDAVAYKVSHLKERVTQACYSALLNYDWPGNVRELENETERLCVLASPEDYPLSEEFLSRRITQTNKTGGQPVTSVTSTSLKFSVEDLEKQIIAEGLTRFSWDQTALAQSLEISPATLSKKIKKYGLDKRFAKAG